MNRIFVTGDTHGDFSRFNSKKFKDGRKLEKSDFMIIAGDFGGIWSTNEYNANEKYWLDWLDEKPWTTLFIDGNHENFERLDRMPEEERFGSPAGVIRPSVLHLKRGYVYEIAEQKIFAFGGGFSIDKMHRRVNVSWWERELPNHQEYSRGLENLEAVDNEVDYVITHSCPEFAFKRMSLSHKMTHKDVDEESQLRNYLDLVHNTINYKSWFCGHFHVNDFSVDNINFLYHSIIELDL